MQTTNIHAGAVDDAIARAVAIGGLVATAVLATRRQPVRRETAAPTADRTAMQPGPAVG